MSAKPQHIGDIADKLYGTATTKPVSRSRFLSLCEQAEHYYEDRLHKRIPNHYKTWEEHGEPTYLFETADGYMICCRESGRFAVQMLSHEWTTIYRNNWDE